MSLSRGFPVIKELETTSWLSRAGFQTDYGSPRSILSGVITFNVNTLSFLPHVVVYKTKSVAADAVTSVVLLQ